MHSAPSVTYPVGRSRWAAALLSLAWLAGAAATLQWTLRHEVSAARLAVAWLVLSAAGAVAAWRWRAQPRGSLAWDGAGWTWDASVAPAASGRLRVSVDLQRVLLVQWHGAGPAQWLWLERASAPERWADLRRAVYSRARPDTLPLTPPAAKP
jgi:toxin CptA